MSSCGNGNLSNTAPAARILLRMAITPNPSPSPPNPTLQRVWALVASMFDYLGDPTRAADLQRLFAEAEGLLARCIFEAAARIAGRPDLLKTHEAYLVGEGASFDIRVRAKPGALHLLHRVIVERRRTGATARYRRALSRRSRFSRKLSYLHFRNQRRRHSATLVRRRAGCASPSHTPARIAAPP